MAKPPSKNKLDINYSLSEIILEEHSANENINVDLSDTKGLQYEFAGSAKLDDKASIIEITTLYRLYKGDSVLFHFKLINKFKLHNTNPSLAKKTYENQHFIKHLFALSVHHLRGMQSIILKDSKYKSLFIPFHLEFNLSKQEKPMDFS